MNSNIVNILTAQNSGEPTNFDRAVMELSSGHKTSHWIWFILPQLKSLGRSPTAIFYGIDDLEEAKLYLQNELLAERLEIIVDLIFDQIIVKRNELEDLMGSRIDAIKTVSSLTVFENAGLESASKILNETGRCEKTLLLINN